MSDKLEKAYGTQLQRALQKCQFIEETLKICLLSAIDIARIQVHPLFPVNIKPEKISSLPLGRLVTAFQMINDDRELHDDLRSITEKRNEVAHRSLLFTIGELEDEAHMSEATLKMKAIADRACNIHSRVLDVRSALLRSLNKAKRVYRREHPVIKRGQNTA